MVRSNDKYKAKVVIIDDDDASRLSIAQMLNLRGYFTQIFNSAEAAVAWPRLPDVDCIIVDVKMPGMDGEEFLAEVIRRNYQPPIILITGHGDVAMAVRALKAGAYDFIEKPFDDDLMLASVSRACEKTNLKREADELRHRLSLFPAAGEEMFGMVGRCRIMQDIFQQVEVVAKSNLPVLIMGETGTGKELLARAIHHSSSRAKGPFVAVNAGALSDNMLESELFGHVKGAYTGADRSRDGKLVTASGGTLLLDEIESISLAAQIKLLRVLEDGMVFPLGKDEPQKVDIRLVATTKVNLLDLVREGRLRRDFYHRIVAFTIMAPPLRERPEDLPLLISHFTQNASRRNNIPVPDFPERTLNAMLRFTWPGNIRQLKHTIEKMVITSTNGIIGEFTEEENPDFTRLLSLPATAGKLKEELEKTEKTVITQSLTDNNGEITQTAQVLGISRRALYERMKKYGLNKEDFRL
jgi:two-component system C4-dicarboxylate transport response regulator DctD